MQRISHFTQMTKIPRWHETCWHFQLAQITPKVHIKPTFGYFIKITPPKGMMKVFFLNKGQWWVLIFPSAPSYSHGTLELAMSFQKCKKTPRLDEQLQRCFLGLSIFLMRKSILVIWKSARILIKLDKGCEKRKNAINL